MTPPSSRRSLSVGLTYDLASEHLAQGASEEEVAEFDSEETVAAIAGALLRMGHRPAPIGGIRALTRRLAHGERWDLVFNIAEGRAGAARESQVPALLDAHDIPYTFSDPLVLALTLHKGHANTLARAAGVPTADSHLVRTEADLARLDLPLPLFVKPVAEGTSRGVTAESIVREPHLLRPLCRELLARYRQPVLVETFLPGREFTVGILGHGARARCLGTLEIHLHGDADAGVYSYRNKKEYLGKVEYRFARPADDPLVAAAEQVALRAWDALGCRDAGRVDVRADASQRPCLIEVNPLPGLHPVISDLSILVRQSGLGYQALLEGIVDSALERVPRIAAAHRERPESSPVPAHSPSLNGPDALEAP